MPLSVDDIFGLPGEEITEDRLAALPEYSCLYFVTLGAELLYIGQTKNLRRRWRNHHHRARCLGISATIRWLDTPACQLAHEEESLIKQHSPAWNSQSEFAFGRIPKAVRARKRRKPRRTEAFADNELGKMRRRLNLTSSQLAQELGVSRHTYMRWERTQEHPAMVMLACRALWHRLG